VSTMSLLEPSRCPICQESAGAFGFSFVTISGLMGIHPPLRRMTNAFSRKPMEIGQKLVFRMLMSENANNITNELM